ncbi:19295_t:CDS:10, partial [Funneliformis geosporum]
DDRPKKSRAYDFQKILLVDMLKEERSKLKYPNYWDKDPNNWGDVNEWDIYWIENQPRSALITKQKSHTALAEELKRLNQIYTGIHPASYSLANPATGIAKSDENKKIWDTRDRIASLKLESELKKGRQAGLQIARRGFQVYADKEFDSVERERTLPPQHGSYTQAQTSEYKVHPSNVSMSPGRESLNYSESSQSKRDREKDLNNEIDYFFQSPPTNNPIKKWRRSEIISNERGISNEADNEKDKDESEATFISEENDDSGFFSLGQPASDTEGQSPPPLLVTEKHELPYCLNCCAEISNFSLIIFCPYCGTKIVSSEDESDTDEENDTGDKDEEDDTPPKVDKVAFRMAYEAIPDDSKLRLSIGTIVEDVLFEFAKDMDYEHHAHSYIVDFDDEDIKALFDEEEWKELTKDRIGVPPVPHDIAKELTKYGKKTLKELRAVVLTPYLKENEEYDVNKHYELEWIQMALRTLCNLYENVDAPLIRKQYEDWFTVALFGACIDFCIRDIQLGTDIKRTDAPSLSSANRKNRDRKANTRTRKLTGRKIDGIIYTVDKLLEVGAIEGARSYSGVSDQKYLIETFKMPKTLRDMYVDIMKAVGYDDQKANKIQVIGILHLGLWIQFARLWRAGGSICIFRKDPLSYNVDSKFSEMGVISFLKLLISIYQYKIITKDNLQVLNIRNNIKPEDDLTNELMK